MIPVESSHLMTILHTVSALTLPRTSPYISLHLSHKRSPSPRRATATAPICAPPAASVGPPRRPASWEDSRTSLAPPRTPPVSLLRATLRCPCGAQAGVRLHHRLLGHPRPAPQPHPGQDTRLPCRCRPPAVSASMGSATRACAARVGCCKGRHWR
jgi:hypothetical protein